MPGLGSNEWRLRGFRARELECRPLQEYAWNSQPRKKERKKEVEEIGLEEKKINDKLDTD